MATLLRQALKSKEAASADQSSIANDRALSEGSESVAVAEPDSAFNFQGMTIQERLQVARLEADFSAAAQRGDREALLEMLDRVQLPSAGAAAFADAVLAHSRQHGG
jgi:hypothetical protein